MLRSKAANLVTRSVGTAVEISGQAQVREEMEITKPTKPNRLLRLNQVLDRIPVSKTTWYDGIKAGRYPSAIRLAPRTSAWLESDIEALIERLGQKETEHVQ